MFPEGEVWEEFPPVGSVSPPVLKSLFRFGPELVFEEEELLSEGADEDPCAEELFELLLELLPEEPVFPVEELLLPVFPETDVLGRLEEVLLLRLLRLLRLEVEAVVLLWNAEPEEEPVPEKAWEVSSPSLQSVDS